MHPADCKPLMDTLENHKKCIEQIYRRLDRLEKVLARMFDRIICSIPDPTLRDDVVKAGELLEDLPDKLPEYLN